MILNKKHVFVFMYIIGICLAFSLLFYNIHVGGISLTKNDLFTSSNCAELEEWYPKTIDSLLVKEVTDNKYRKGVGKLIILENNSEILFGRVSYPDDLIKKGDTLYKEKNSLLLYISRGNNNLQWDIKNLYHCEDFTPVNRSLPIGRQKK